VNKLLGLLVLGLAFSLMLGTAGCTKKEDEKKKEEKKADEDKKKEDGKKKEDPKKKEEGEEKAKLKVKEPEGEVTLKKDGKTTITVELKEEAPHELTLKAKAGKDAKGIEFADGKIEKKGTKGMIDVTTTKDLAGVTEIVVEITGNRTEPATVTYKVKKE